MRGRHSRPTDTLAADGLTALHNADNLAADGLTALHNADNLAAVGLTAPQIN